jgi:hypothetical protein
MGSAFIAVRFSMSLVAFVCNFATQARDSARLPDRQANPAFVFFTERALWLSRTM